MDTNFSLLSYTTLEPLISTASAADTASQTLVYSILCSDGLIRRNLSLIQVGFCCKPEPQGSMAAAFACRNRLLPLGIGKAHAAWKCCRAKRSRLDSTPTPDTSDVDLQQQCLSINVDARNGKTDPWLKHDDELSWMQLLPCSQEGTCRRVADRQRQRWTLTLQNSSMFAAQKYVGAVQLLKGTR